ncbi:MAG: tetratricopeptide repeat protein [Ardenticatenaceae bacterium]|nr:tetratricopeptide repeat protein [Ardenticatenaceae bacterium]
MTAVLHIQLFGGLTISQGETPVSGFISHKVPALLAYLAVTHRPHQRDTLAALFWGEMSEADAKNNLRQALSNLRKQLDPYLLVTRETVQFNTAVPHTLDTAQFERHLQNGRDAHEANRIAAFQQAAALYQGDFLAGFFVREAPEFEEWLLAQRVRYRELALHTLHTLTEHHLSRGEYGRAIDSATRLLALDAWREEAHRQLMLAQLRSGQRSAALAQYELCRQLLDEELGVEPSPETIALYERIREAKHRVHLPLPTTPFVGRANELAHLARLLADPTCHLITLSGTGGSGKTRLALETAVRAAHLFLHGVCFVPLAAVNSLEVVPSTIAEALGAALSGTADPHDQLLTHLRDKELLLVLDNLEHLTAADEWVSRLIQACPEVRLLVTSRERLNLRGERLMELDGLELPPVPDKNISDYSAAQLFLNSARMVTPDFALNEGNQTAVTRICQLVNGLPLAIELAAAWVRHLTCAEIAHEIEQNLSFLATTQKDVPARHRSLQAAFEQSWALLSDEERTAFVRLSVFRGGCTREAATAVAQAHLSILAALCDKSLLRRDVDGRYTLHELLRQYAAQKLQTDQIHLSETQARHCQTTIRFLADHEAALNDARQNETRRKITAEIDNIRTAWEWAVNQQQPHMLEPALESLRLFLEYTGWYTEAVHLFEIAAEAEHKQKGEKSLLFGKLLARQAWFYHRQDRFELARPLIAQSQAIFHHAPSLLPAEEALCLQCLGNMARVTGEFVQAIAYFQQSLAQHRLVGDARYIATSLNGLAAALAEQGEFEQAYHLHQECLSLRRQMGDQQGVAITLVNLGNIALGQAKYAEGKPLEQEAIVIFREIGYPMGEAVALNNLGVACYMLGEYDEARGVLEECLTICRELGHRHIAAHALGTLGGVAGALGNYDEAWQYTHEGLQMAQAIGSVSAMLFGLMSTAVLLSRQGNYEQAAETAVLVYHHPSTNRETKDRAHQLLTQLETQPPASLLVAAQERGQVRQLEDVVSEILSLSVTQV